MGTLPLTTYCLVLIWWFGEKKDSNFLSLSQSCKKRNVSLRWNDGLLVSALAVSLSWCVVNEVTTESAKMLVLFLLWQMWCCRAVGWFSTDMNSVLSSQTGCQSCRERYPAHFSFHLRVFFRNYVYYGIHQFFSVTWMKFWRYFAVRVTSKGARPPL